jgi:uncharacterized metal-binding protein
LLFACSGGSDVGELADRACRKLAEQGKGQMYCLAGIGGDVSAIVKTTEAADELVTVDGCPVSCAAATLKRAGFDRFQHVVVTQLGLRQGEHRAESCGHRSRDSGGCGTT